MLTFYLLLPEFRGLSLIQALEVGRRELRTKELLGMVTDITYQNWCSIRSFFSLPPLFSLLFYPFLRSATSPLQCVASG